MLSRTLYGQTSPASAHHSDTSQQGQHILCIRSGGMDLPVDLDVVHGSPPTLVVPDFKITKTYVPHESPAIWRSRKLGAGLASFCSFPDHVTSANHVSIIVDVDIDKLDLPVKSNEPPEMTHVCSIVYGASIISDKKVVPEEALGVLLDSPFLHRAVTWQMCLKWLLLENHHARLCIPLSYISCQCQL